MQTSLELELAYRDLEGAMHSHSLAVSFDAGTDAGGAGPLADQASSAPETSPPVIAPPQGDSQPLPHTPPPPPSFVDPQNSFTDWLEGLSLPTRGEDGESILDRAETIFGQGLETLGISDVAPALDQVLLDFANNFDPLPQGQDLIADLDAPMPDLGLLDILSPSSGGGSLLAGLFDGDGAQPIATADLGALSGPDAALPDLGELSNSLLALHSGSGIGGLIDHDPFEGLFG